MSFTLNMCKICRAIVKSLPSEKLLVDYVHFFKRIHQDDLTPSQVMGCAKQALYTVEEIFKRNLQDSLEKVIVEVEETFYEQEQNAPPSNEHPAGEDGEPLSHDEKEVRDAGGPSESSGSESSQAPKEVHEGGTPDQTGPNAGKGSGIQVLYAGGGSLSLGTLREFFALMSSVQRDAHGQLPSDQTPASSD